MAWKLKSEELEEIKAELISIISKEFSGKLNNYWATIYGHIINRIMETTTVENDGTINYTGWVKNTDATCQAEKYLYALYADYNGKKLYIKG